MNNLKFNELRTNHKNNCCFAANCLIIFTGTTVSDSQVIQCHLCYMNVCHVCHECMSCVVHTSLHLLVLNIQQGFVAMPPSDPSNIETCVAAEVTHSLQSVLENADAKLNM